MGSGFIGPASTEFLILINSRRCNFSNCLKRVLIGKHVFRVFAGRHYLKRVLGNSKFLIWEVLVGDMVKVGLMTLTRNPSE